MPHPVCFLRAHAALLSAIMYFFHTAPPRMLWTSDQHFPRTRGVAEVHGSWHTTSQPLFGLIPDGTSLPHPANESLLCPSPQTSRIRRAHVRATASTPHNWLPNPDSVTRLFVLQLFCGPTTLRAPLLHLPSATSKKHSQEISWGTAALVSFGSPGMRRGASD